jgi:hypothetical protein
VLIVLEDAHAESVSLFGGAEHLRTLKSKIDGVLGKVRRAF